MAILREGYYGQNVKGFQSFFDVFIKETLACRGSKHNFSVPVIMTRSMNQGYSKLHHQLREYKK